MIINLSHNSEDLFEYLKDHNIDQKEIILFDVTGICHGNFSRRIAARTLDVGNRIERIALNDYIETIGELSTIVVGKRTSVRDLKVNGLPIFWLTRLAEKHDLYHWGQAFFFLKHLLIHFPEIVKDHKSITLIMPKGSEHAVSLIKTIFRPDKELEIIFKSYRYEPSFLKLFKSILLDFKTYVLSKAQFETSVENDRDLASIIFIGSYQNKTTAKVKAFAQAIKPTDLIPTTPYIKGAKDWEEIPSLYLKQHPGYLRLFQLYYKLICTYIRVKCINEETTSSVDHSYLKIIKTEMLKVLMSPSLFFQHLLLLSFFKKVDQHTKVFYEDEFYVIGRIISSAANLSGNKLIVTFGIQHGIISESHTVYRFSKKELLPLVGNDALPCPDYFIVWGDLFRKFMVDRSNLNFNSILVNGNLFYIDNTEKIKSPLRNRSNKIKILWCTTLLNYALLEYHMIEAYLKESTNISLSIRLHPVSHIKMGDLERIISPTILSFTTFDSGNTNLIELIKLHDVILTSAQSTIFLDAIVAGKMVLRADLGVYMRDQESGFGSLMRYISNSDEFKDVINNLSYFQMNNFDLSGILYPYSDEWKDTFEL